MTTTTTRRLVVTVSGPPRELHPNWRGHWAPKSRATRDAKFDADVACRVALGDFHKGGHRTPVSAITLKRTFYVPDKRARDIDNLEASTKSMADGISLALGVNDRIFTWLPSEVVVERGRREVVFEIEVE